MEQLLGVLKRRVSVHPNLVRTVGSVWTGGELTPVSVLMDLVRKIALKVPFINFETSI